MANEIQANVSFRVANGSFTDQLNIPNGKYTQNTLGASAGIVSVTTGSGVLLPVGSVATNGYLVLLNLDSTNYVQFGSNNSGSLVVFGRMNAGEFAVMRVDPSIAVRLAAHTATCLVQFMFLND